MKEDNRKLIQFKVTESEHSKIEALAAKKVRSVPNFAKELLLRLIQ